MATIVERVRNVVSIEDDDFFQNDLIVYYANQSKEAVISYLLQREFNTNKSVRGLDELRDHVDVDLTLQVFNESGSYYTVEIDKPEVREFLFARVGFNTPVRSLTGKALFQLNTGNLKPSNRENYYYITDNTIELYTHDNTSENLRIFYLKNPSIIKGTDTDLGDLPDRFINAVVYGGAYMAVLQEGFEMEGEISNANSIKELYNEELQLNSY